MNHNDMMHLKNTITMPDTLAEALVQGCTAPQKSHARHARTHFSRLAVPLIAVFALFLCGTTSFAYNLYQEYTLAVFWEKGLSADEIDHLGQSLSELDGVSSCRFISGDEAWAEFSAAYLDADTVSSFTENPLADSGNYRLSISLQADTGKIRAKIADLAGVRLVQNLKELK